MTNLTAGQLLDENNALREENRCLKEDIALWQKAWMDVQVHMANRGNTLLEGQLKASRELVDEAREELALCERELQAERNKRSAAEALRDKVGEDNANLRASLVMARAQMSHDSDRIDDLDAALQAAADGKPIPQADGWSGGE